MNKKSINQFKLGSSYKKDAEFINSLYKYESDPIFEFSPYHVLSYLAFENELYGISKVFLNGVIIAKSDTQILFTPQVKKLDQFNDWLKENPQIKKIQNVSEGWVCSFSKKVSGEAIPRSKEEAIYDVRRLSSLKGKEFAKLRQTKNKLLKSKLLKFQNVNDSNISDAIKVLTKWQKVQGYKYDKNKFEKEKFVLKKFLKISKLTSNLLFEIGYVDNNPLCICAMHKIDWKKDWGVIYLVKGINRKFDGGVHGISDASYCHLFDQANRWGLKYLNDGELGYEPGTREHKLRFKPIRFLKSFDIKL